MRRVNIVLVALAIVLSAATVMAQKVKPGDVGLPAWDASTVQTFSGTVEIEKDTLTKPDVFVVVVRSGAEQKMVALGLKRTLDPALTSLAAKTPIEVTASKVTANGKVLYLASHVKVGGKDYHLRDEQGHALGKDGQPLPHRKR